MSCKRAKWSNARHLAGEVVLTSLTAVRYAAYLMGSQFFIWRKIFSSSSGVSLCLGGDEGTEDLAATAGAASSRQFVAAAASQEDAAVVVASEDPREEGDGGGFIGQAVSVAPVAN